MSGRMQWLWEVYVISHVGGHGRFRSSALSVLLELSFFLCGCIIESTVNPFAILMQSSLIQEEIGWSGYLYLSKCLLMWQTERERGRGKGKGTDGGSERAEEIGETDHLRSVGRQHKPVGEGRSLLDSVLQRDGRRDGEGGGGENGKKNENENKERTENGQDRYRDKERYREGFKEQDRNWLRCREPSGGKITQGVGEIWVVISQLFRMPVHPRCLH